MIRRHVLAAAAAATALILLPATVCSATSAMAHSSAGLSSIPADPKPAAGVPFKVHAAGAKPYEAVTLTMTRKPEPVNTPVPRPITKKANADGAVDFAVTLTEDGTWTLVSTSTVGAVLGTQTVTVADQGAVIIAGESAAEGAAGGAEATAGGVEAGAGGAEATAGGAEAGAGGTEGAARGTEGASRPRTGSQLSDTGFRGMGLAVGGGVLVLVGTGLVLVARPRKLALVPA